MIRGALILPIGLAALVLIAAGGWSLVPGLGMLVPAWDLAFGPVFAAGSVIVSAVCAMTFLVWLGPLVLAPLPGLAALSVAAGACVALGVVAGIALTRNQALRPRRRQIIDWEWVYTGAEFARRHAPQRLPVGVWLTLVCLFAAALLMALSGRPLGLRIVTCAVLLAPVLPMLKRHPAAYPLMLLALGTALFLGPVLVLPMLVPLAFYWADGVWPNLIYRHRFERLVPREDNTCSNEF
ncbi:MAG: hypothetical protein CSA65_05535 [Proteobacteria bacterium]|nr:MAG: hypothetical protein CSA65_05535 [Pseudomonadota bacterium]